jgi:CheY-like chemotaxis protein
MTEQSQQILYVDDDRSLRDEISLFLPGYRISSCETIGEGLTLATHQTFALYLLNLSLPDGSGIRKYAPLISTHRSLSFRFMRVKVTANMRAKSELTDFGRRAEI